MTPQQFILKWRDNPLAERAGAQPHFLDLCELLGVEKPGNPDQGDNYCFERGATKTGAGRGWADVWKRGFFGWEYKGPGAKLEPALKQLMMYALALDNPPLLVVSDRLSIQIHTHFTGRPSQVHTVHIDDIGLPENLEKLRWLFTDPEQFKPQITRSAITTQAAKLFGDIARAMQERGHEPRDAAHFLNKMLFCLFAQNIKSPHGEPLLPDRLFSAVLANGLKDATRFAKQLKNLFRCMSEPNGEFGLHLIEWFNGGLFDGDKTLPLKHEDIRKLVDIASLDWSAIDPTIFGTLFERGLNPKKRSQLGANYTDAATIMRIVNPVVVEPLAAEWKNIRGAIATQMTLVHEISAKARAKAAEKARATIALKDANKMYLGFLDRLEKFRVLDPACGSGNFLYLALQSVKDIEHRAGLEVEALGLQRNLIPHTGPHNLLGIELDDYAAELARLTVWIGEIQWMVRHGYEPSKNPILKPLNQIECRDALVTTTASPRDRGEGQGGGQTVEAKWPHADVIIGNPPFLGDKKMRGELGEDYTDVLRKTYAESVPGGADLVCYWFDKARKLMESGVVNRVGLVATNSIRGGANRRVLDQILVRCQIFEAWSDEEWVNEGAAVRVSIVCFGPNPNSRVDEKSDLSVLLDGAPVGRISASLKEGSAPNSSGQVDLTLARSLRENARIAFSGITKKGAFDIPGTLARELIAVSGNPNSRPNSDVLFPWQNGEAVTGRNQDKWIINFGERDESESAKYAKPFTHAYTNIKPMRALTNSVSERNAWWKLARRAPGMFLAIHGLSRFLVTPEVSKHRVFVWRKAPIVADKNLVVIARDDDVAFGILQSRVHAGWALQMGTSLEDRPRYTFSTTFETFPFAPGLTPNLKPREYANPYASAISGAATRLNELRETWLNPPEWVDVVPEVVPGYPDRIIPKPEYEMEIKKRTLTNLYNERPTWLAHAHEALDMAVAKAYAWVDYTPTMPDEEILARLLMLNLERAHAVR